MEQAEDREGGSSTVFGINTEEQGLQSQVEHSIGIHWGASDNCFQRANLVGNCDRGRPIRSGAKQRDSRQAGPLVG